MCFTQFTVVHMDLVQLFIWKKVWRYWIYSTNQLKKNQAGFTATPFPLFSLYFHPRPFFPLFPKIRPYFPLFCIILPFLLSYMNYYNIISTNEKKEKQE